MLVSVIYPCFIIFGHCNIFALSVFIAKIYNFFLLHVLLHYVVCLYKGLRSQKLKPRRLVFIIWSINCSKYCYIFWDWSNYLSRKDGKVRWKKAFLGPIFYSLPSSWVSNASLGKTSLKFQVYQNYSFIVSYFSSSNQFLENLCAGLCLITISSLSMCLSALPNCRRTSFIFQGRYKNYNRNET